ncbi:MAG: hypothetical protein NTZ40_13055 [Cyanobacteria bacterium]|nr:hypothetical protein [Cyanobacteriota bacterium]
MPFVADTTFWLFQVRSSIRLNLATALGAALPLAVLPLAALPLGAQPLGAKPLAALPLEARAEGFGAIVQAMCLTAFQSEMSQAGKVAPEGMAGFACRCVANRIVKGSGVEEARRECRLATMQRFPI